MRRFIHGKLYDTDTARCIASVENEQTGFVVKLYRKLRGEYFLLSEHAPGVGELLPLSYEEAETWGRRNLEPAVYASCFNGSDTKTRTVSIRLSGPLIAKLNRLAAQQGVCKSDIVSRLLESADE